MKEANNLQIAKVQPKGVAYLLHKFLLISANALPEYKLFSHFHFMVS